MAYEARSYKLTWTKRNSVYYLRDWDPLMKKCYLFVHLVLKANNTLLNFLRKELAELKIFWN
jgi:hypothetical protein